MNILKKILFAVMLFLLIFSQQTEAYYNDKELYSIHYYVLDEFSNESWMRENIYIQNDITVDERIEVLFDYFFKHESISCVPVGVEVLSSNIEGECLILNVSEEITGYGGGYNERILKNQILKTALNISGISSLTLLIEGKNTALPEGSLIINISEWLE